MTTTHAHTVRCWWNPDEARWVCASEGATAAPIDTPLVDVRDMIVVHTALLREFRLAPAAVSRVQPGAARAAAAVERHLGFLCDLLHHHHQGEDDLLWPLLRERVPASAMALLDEVDGQHAGIEESLQAVGAARAAWVDEPDERHRTELVAALEHLYPRLRTHLDLEESSVLPLVASAVTDAEWQAVGAAGAASVPKPLLMLVFGMFAYEGDPAVLRSMLAAAPPPVRFLVPRIAPRVYARRARQVHGTAQP